MPDAEFAVFHEIAMALNASVELEEALDTALKKAGELMGLETGWIWLLDGSTGDPYLAASRNLPEGLRRRPELLDGRCYCLNTFETGDLEGAANINVVRCSRLKQLSEGSGGFAHHTSVPLYGRDDTRLGVMNLATQDWRELSEDELQTLQTVSDLIAIAVERTRLFERSLELGAAQERNRLAREMHDTITQDLAGLVMQLESARVQLRGDDGVAAADEAVERALELARDNLRDARRSVRDLRAAPLDGRDLAEALADLLDERAERNGWEMQFDPPDDAPALSDPAETALYRVAQEALANVAQHARASSVSVELQSDDEAIRLTVRDDGVGFDADELGDTQWGLQGMRERIDRLGGELHVESTPSEGTTVTASIPRERR